MNGKQVVEKILELHRTLDTEGLSKQQVMKIEREMVILSRAIVHTVCEKTATVTQEEFPNLATDHALFGSLKTLEARLNKYGSEEIEA